MPAEACSHESFRELQEPEGVDGKTGLGGAGRGIDQMCSEMPGAGRHRAHEREGVEPGDPRLACRPQDGISGPIPHPPHPSCFQVSLASSPEVREFPQPPPCCVQTCSPTEAPATACSRLCSAGARAFMACPLLQALVQPRLMAFQKVVFSLCIFRLPGPRLPLGEGVGRQGWCPVIIWTPCCQWGTGEQARRAGVRASAVGSLTRRAGEPQGRSGELAVQ